MTNTPTTTTIDLARLEIRCPGCGRSESIDVDPEALAAYSAGELTDRQAFPDHTFEEHTLIECGWHVDRWELQRRPRPPPVAHRQRRQPEPDRAGATRKGGPTASSHQLAQPTRQPPPTQGSEQKGKGSRCKWVP